MGKFSQAGKMLWWKARGMSQEEMAQKLMEDPGVQDMMAKVQKGIAEGKITQADLLRLQQKATRAPQEAQREFEALLKKVEE